ncbi:hypothetical protein A3K55_01465 [Candidatus Shapirobacteria bacterium RBG_13_44_7]|uniref:Uncharacterized protein n=1 Tax=Candidatus Shapirobacteria bacterium RBG_13_44_7 TaxID=1802149 RepID=A0A1F7SIU7_9BACT|nr:MAG: hypothetical protein A3K55_01465 [Candidatus Shapirobacteria bacterium RBG_13_44_7]
MSHQGITRETKRGTATLHLHQWPRIYGRGYDYLLGPDWYTNYQGKEVEILLIGRAPESRFKFRRHPTPAYDITIRRHT